MITRFATLTSRLAVLLTFAVALVACGGGGGGGGGGFLGGGSGDDENTDTYFLTVLLRDADGNPTSTVTANKPGTLQVLVQENNDKGDPVPDVIVTASTDSGLLFPSSGSKLTNAEGGVTFRVEAGEGRGAGTIVVSVTDENGVEVTETVNFEIGAGNLRLGYLLNGEFFDGEIGIAPDGPIASKGEAALTLAIVDENDLPVGSSESIRINSECIDSGDSSLSIDNPIPVLGGRIQLTYTAESCSGSDDLTAEIIGDGARALGTIQIADPTADGLTFISADPTLIVLRGTGGGPNRQEQSKVTFQAVDATGVPQEGVQVQFALTTDVGGLSITPMSAITDAEGNVTTNVFSGDVATVVRVVATLDSEDGSGQVSAVSDVLSVSTGLPDQNSISLSVEGSFVVEEAFTTDGVTRNITVRMADKFNNPVPDGTAAVFTTEYGSIEPSCETVGGACTVVWTSQAPRVPTLEENQQLVRTINDPDYSCPSHSGTSGPCPDDLGFIRGGRSTILVTAIGEESFIDRNGNGVFDQDEADDDLWFNLTEAWLDNNENGRYDPATTACQSFPPPEPECSAGSEEIFTDFNSNGRFDANGDDPGNGYPDEGIEAVYNGLLCPVEGDGVWCSRELLNVYDFLGVILSADPNWDIALYRSSGLPATSTAWNGGVYTAYISDVFNNKPTAGSKITLEVSGDCEILGKDTFEVPNTTAPGAFAISFNQGGEGEESGEVTITLTPQDGGPDYSESWTCLPEPPPPPVDPNDPGDGLVPGG